MELQNIHLSYISNNLIEEIAEKLLPNKLLDHTVQHSGGLDGFMSALYSINIKILDANTNEVRTQVLLAKFMKGDENFRVCSRSYIQFANEICIYSKVLPYYSEFSKKYGITAFNVEDWAPKVYVAKYGKIDGLCNCFKTSNESVLVMENLNPFGYKLGPRLYLNRIHFDKIMEPLARYHAMTYALAIMNDPMLDQLKANIIPLPFVVENGFKTNMYEPLYRIAFDRFFDYFDRSKTNLLRPGNANDSKLEKSILTLREKYGENPAKLLEYIRLEGNEGDFSTILHGDFNRNNVLFRYGEPGGEPEDAKLIDFQEVRVGSPCIDLSFSMYMNLDRSIRDDEWLNILKCYNDTVCNTLEGVITKSDAKRLPLINKFRFEPFYEHFKKYAFYGAMVCTLFLPWIVGTEDELQQLSTWFERDMHSKEYRDIAFTAGGDDANHRIFEIYKHACKMGYLDIVF